VTFDVEYDMVTSENCDPLVQYDWIDASLSPSIPYPPGDEGYRSVSLTTLPEPTFTFNYGGTDYTSVTIHDNGFISLGGDKNTVSSAASDGNYKNNQPLPTPLKPDNFIAPFWDNLTGSGGGSLFVKTIGSTPTRQFVIEYSGVQQVGVSGSLDFEVVLFEGSNNIKMQYRTLTGTGSDGSSATVGLEYGNIFSGFGQYEYSYNRPGALKNGLAILFIPYISGDPTLPSNAVCPQMQARTIEAGMSNACNASPAVFDVDIAAGILPYRSALKVQQLTTAPNMPAAFLDLNHYADINLAYSPPAPQLSPMPEGYVCYGYTPEDLLTAGGHPENLFIAVHDESTNQWQLLPTTVDVLNMRLTALAQHFSYYGVATLKASASRSGGLNLPVTGNPLSQEFLIFLIAGIIMIFLLSGTWLKRKHSRK
jgi:hypothetical protein